MFMAVVGALVVIGTWLGARLLRSRAQEPGLPPRSLVAELSWLLVLVLPWGLLLGVGAFAISLDCHEGLAYADLAPGVTGDAYCDGVLQERFPGTVIAVSVLVASVALVWTVTVLLLRAAERRRETVS